MALRSTASYFFRNTEKRYPYVTKAAAQQQHSSSSAAAQQKQQRRRWWRWRRRRRRRRRQHGKPFFAELSQQHRSPQNIIISTTSGETLNTIYNTNQKKEKQVHLGPIHNLRPHIVRRVLSTRLLWLLFQVCKMVIK